QIDGRGEAPEAEAFPLKLRQLAPRVDFAAVRSSRQWRCSGMSLRLYFHPLSSFCQKVLIALYENGTRFEPHVVEFENEASRAELEKMWPVGKIPVLRDEARDRTVPESSTIIEYLAQHYPGGTQ